GAADVALPEAADTAAATRAPDLATALRRFPGISRIRVLGEGLEPRDREAARGVTVAFDAPVPRRGIVALAPPPRVAPGAGFRVGGQVAAMPGARIDLLDPAGRVVDGVAARSDGTFVLSGAARVPGVALFRVRVREGETVEVPVVTAAARPVRVLYLAGAPGPEAKYWRRWAADAGLAATVSMPAGGGIELGDAAPAITAATLARYDVVVIDDRRWAALGGGARAALAAAVRGGMGLLLRATGPVPAGWATIGAPVGAARGQKPVRMGGGDMPVSTRIDVLAPDAIPLARDAAGVPFAAWRGVGRGRIGVWTLADSFALVTSGHGALFGELWSGAISTLARADAAVAPTVSDRPVPGERAVICGAATVTAPDGRVTALSPAQDGCAAYWPALPGWHRAGRGAAMLPFHVARVDAIAGLRAEERASATRAIASSPPSAVAPPSPQPTRPGRSWPWLLAFLAAAGASWWFERRTARRGQVYSGPGEPIP
ncbi:hypothetical protein ASG29_08610, partial [Sphingomonas sp. Leaf412]|uniref:hypothetical protein n=1 Tax=Sphingomonas sp. Leaf412 TaxID=1736370 RepID=UPI0006FB0E9E